MKTDKLAYLWLQEVPEGFFALIGRNKSDATRYVFKSVELKDVAFRLDGVFVPQVDDVVYFVEIQFQRDEGFYARLFAQIFLYLKQFGANPWQAVVIYPTRSVEQTNRRGYEELLETRLVRRVYLDELPSLERLDGAVGVFKLVIEPEPTVIASAKALIERAPERLDFIERVLFYKFKNLTRKEILKMLNVREEFEQELKKTRAYQEILEEGREEGRAEGVVKGKLATVPLLRELGLNDDVIAARLHLPLEEVKKA
ncbi:MAG: Rpn family recombination-promoting nuclease/putative transposase [Chloroherpetonaceae bacterium]|nr:Rpn family recombination-promoting nuclease/putative transposase [Chloroherpetonaceae bacterium]MDW8437072.1 Rpn family recombination-promoting nuclease/putative transposase [Chloroherpetonaceae bacterium]